MAGSRSSIVAIDVTAGKLRWSFQTVRKDVWDYDIGSQPRLILTGWRQHSTRLTKFKVLALPRLPL